MKNVLILLVSMIAAFSVACGDEHDHNNDHEHGEETPQEEACEHMIDGPAIDVTAADAADMAPDGTAEHTRVDVTFVTDDMGMNVGYVSYQAEETGEYLVFTSSALAPTILDANGAEVAIEATESVSECDEVVEQHLVDLEVGTYTFVFGPTSEEGISYVVEHAGEHEGHSDE